MNNNPSNTVDTTKSARRELTGQINSVSAQRAAMEQEYGRVYNTDEMTSEFSVVGFLAPFVVVRRKSDGVKGTLMFQHNPRFYFAFEAES
jgi:hypothetical protein